MMPKSPMIEKYGKLLKSPESHAEWLSLHATELICRAMEEAGLKRFELAKKLGVKKPYITQLLSGRRNMTIHTLAKVLFHCGQALKLQPVTLDEAYELPFDCKKAFIVNKTVQKSLDPEFELDPQYFRGTNFHEVEMPTKVEPSHKEPQNFDFGDLDEAA